MSTHAQAGTQQPAYAIGKPYTVTAYKVDHGSANRMHDDELARKLGFQGGFVLGLGVYGLMTRALVAEHGEDWLGQAMVELDFRKPVHSGDRIQVFTEPDPKSPNARAYRLRAVGEDGVERVRMQTWCPNDWPEVHPLADLPPVEWEGEKQRRSWELMKLHQPFRALRYTPTLEENRSWCAQLHDDLPIYVTGDAPPLHPTFAMRHVQMCSTNQFLGDSAVHDSTRAIIRKALRVGQQIEVRNVPVEKYEKKGNHWVVMYSVVRADGEVALEQFHKQIFKMRGS